MVPVVQKYMTQINVVVGRCRAIDQNTSEYTIPCLDVEVGVIPASTIFDCTPLVGIRISWGNRTLCYTRDSIHLVGPILSDTVEMQAGAIILEGIRNMYNCIRDSVLAT